MKKQWSSSWISSKQPRKQRKYRKNAPLHMRRHLLSAHLSKEIQKRFGRKSLPVRKGDEIIVMTGSSKGHRGKVERVDLKKIKVYVDGIKVKKVDGSEVPRPLDPSNLQIINLNMDDKKRQKSAGKETKPKATKKAEEAAKELKEENTKPKEKKPEVQTKSKKEAKEKMK